jgi:hypothetical protein
MVFVIALQLQEQLKNAEALSKVNFCDKGEQSQICLSYAERKQKSAPLKFFQEL